MSAQQVMYAPLADVYVRYSVVRCLIWWIDWRYYPVIVSEAFILNSWRLSRKACCVAGNQGLPPRRQVPAGRIGLICPTP